MLALSDIAPFVGNVRIRTDSETLVKALLHHQDAAKEIKPILANIRVLASSFSSCPITKVSRSLVSKAHAVRL